MKRTRRDTERAQLGSTILDLVFVAIGLFLIGIFTMLNGIMLDPLAEALIGAGDNLGAVNGVSTMNTYYSTAVRWGPLAAGLSLIGVALFRAWRRARRTAFTPRP